jgi:hypothetical protein
MGVAGSMPLYPVVSYEQDEKASQGVVEQEIDGDNNGRSGSDYIATVSGTRVTTGGIPLARIQRQPTQVADAIDHLLDRGELRL